MSEFTKGPWNVGNYSYGDRDDEVVIGQHIYDLNARLVADTCKPHLYQDECLANAHLIAASPTMFAYIEKKANEGDEDAKSIIAKACGK